MLCRHDHRLKHDAGWQLHPADHAAGSGSDAHRDVAGAGGAADPATGMVWQSPLGHRYPSRPPPVIVPLPEPYPDPDGRFTLPEHWYHRFTTPTCGCTTPCDCLPPLLNDHQDTATGPTPANPKTTAAQPQPDPPSYAPDDTPPF